MCKYLRLMEAERKWKADAYCCIVRWTRPEIKGQWMSFIKPPEVSLKVLDLTAFVYLSNTTLEKRLQLWEKWKL